MSGVADVSDAAILAAIATNPIGGRTHRLVERLGLSLLTDRPALYRRLARLEATGKIERDPRYTAINSVYWRLPTTPASSARGLG